MQEKEHAAFTGVEGLFRLWQKAMSMYHAAVVCHGISYQSFAEDFIHLRTHHDSDHPAVRNDHTVNLGRIRRLLRHEAIVSKFSELPLTEENFIECMRQVMLTPPDKPRISCPNFQCIFDRNTLERIAQAANDVHLFKEDVTAEDMHQLFNECDVHSVRRLHAGSNQLVAYFLSCMDSKGLIAHNYQQVVELNRLICSSRKGKPLTAHDLARALDSFNGSRQPVRDRIDYWVKRIFVTATDPKRTDI